MMRISGFPARLAGDGGSSLRPLCRLCGFSASAIVWIGRDDRAAFGDGAQRGQVRHEEAASVYVSGVRGFERQAGAIDMDKAQPQGPGDGLLAQGEIDAWPPDNGSAAQALVEFQIEIGHTLKRRHGAEPEDVALQALVVGKVVTGDQPDQGRMLDEVSPGPSAR